MLQLGIVQVKSLIELNPRLESKLAITKFHKGTGAGYHEMKYLLKRFDLELLKRLIKRMTYLH